MDINEFFLRNLVWVRRVLVLRFSWFMHVSEAGSLDQIRRDGLEPRGDSAPPLQVSEIIRDGAKNRVCWNPLGARLVPGPTKPPPYICFAIEARQLPARAGLDWSETSSRDLADQLLKTRFPSPSSEEIFDEVVRRHGTFITYDGVEAAHLRVFTKGARPHDPLTWPMLSAAKDDDIQQFG